MTRLRYSLYAVVVVALGLLLRSSLLPSFVQFIVKYGGDALWAALVYLLIRFVSPKSKIRNSALIAFAFAVCVEVSQLYHAGWIDSLRATRLGGLILGSTFNWPDIAAYAVGIIAAAVFDTRKGK